MMREAVILNDYASINGGSSAVAIASACGLAKRGFAVTYFSCVGPVAAELQGVPGLTVICLGQAEIVQDPNRLRAFTRGLRNGPAVRALEKLLAPKDRARTVVHVHTWSKALSPFAVSTAIRLGFQVIVTMHDFFTACPTGTFFVHGANRICHRLPLSLDCLGCHCDRRSYAQKLWRAARTFLQNHLLSVPAGFAHFISVSDFSAKILRPHLPAQAKITMVRNPVDAAKLPPAPVESNRPFVFIGRFAPEKGPLLFAEAVRLSGVPAVFIGDGELREEVRALCPEATFTGWLPPEDVLRWLREARALVFPPLWYETLGLVVIEAAANGVPAIAADGCAATDYLADGETGLFFSHGSAEALAARLRELQDGALAAQLGRRAYDWYWENPWTTERHLNELLAVYEEILAA